MRFRDFMAAIFAGRFVRFLVLSLLTLWFGPQIVGLVGALFRRHFYWVLAVVVLGGLIWLLRWRSKRPRAAN
jgi:membrane protein DedA with SNARE-associated domain